MQLNGPITNHEVADVIKSLPFEKSPGKDSIPSELYMILIEELGENPDENPLVQWLVATFEASRYIKSLPPSMRQIIIRLIYKKESDEGRVHPKNYRPISLLNTDYKILSKALANRLNKCLHKIIPKTQMAVKGRRITEAILLVQSIMNLYENHPDGDAGAALLFLDLEKAFDSCSHKFIEGMRVIRVLLTWKVHCPG